MEHCFQLLIRKPHTQQWCSKGIYSQPPPPIPTLKSGWRLNFPTASEKGVLLVCYICELCGHEVNQNPTHQELQLKEKILVRQNVSEE